MNSPNSSSSPSSPQQQGWMKKKGKKRWFILYNHVVYWFKNEQKTATFNHAEIKGCLELKGCSAAACKDKPINSFVISNLKDMNYYVLTAYTREQCDQWIAAVQASIEATKQEEAQVEVKRGVLGKKGKERLFVLTGDSLIWFLSRSGVEKKAKGSLPLAKAKVQRGSKPSSFVISPRTGKPYELIAKSVEECDAWMAAVHGVLERLEDGQVEEKSGYLMKKGKKRWFIIKNGKLLWFDKLQSDISQTANNYILLANVAVSAMPSGSGKYPFKLGKRKDSTASVKKEYILTASSERECKDWMDALVGAGAENGNGANDAAPAPTDGKGTLLRNKSSGNVHHSSLVASAPAPSLLAELDASGSRGRGKGPRLSGGATISHQISPGHLSASRESGLFLDAFQAYKSELPDKKSGWLQKKGKQRWFVLEAGSLSWYAQPKKHESGATPNGSLTIAECNVSSIGQLHEGYAFAIYSRKEKGKEYILMATSTSEMEDWVLILLACGAIVDKDRKGTVSTGDDEGSEVSRPTGPPRAKSDKDGWLEKKSKRRWFVLKNGRLSWYKNVPQDEEEQKNPAGYLDLKQCFVRTIDKKIKNKYAFLIWTGGEEKKREYILLHSNEMEIKEWVDATISKGGAKRDVSVAGKSLGPALHTPLKGRVFGAPLDDVLKREGRTESGVPELVEKCVAYIRQYGMDVEGIFRVSGDTGAINQLRELIEKSVDSSNPFNNIADFEFDIHTISGLLKSYLREMDPPLLTWELYRDFVEAAGRDLPFLIELIGRLPPSNGKLLRYLMFFLNEVASHSDKSKMAPMNLAIVFAPNVFRSNGDPLEVLANTAQTATVAQAMIMKYKEIWPGATNVVEVKQIVVDSNSPADTLKRSASPPGRPQPPLPSRLGNQPQLPLQELNPKNLKPAARGAGGGPGKPPPGSFSPSQGLALGPITVPPRPVPKPGAKPSPSQPPAAQPSQPAPELPLPAPPILDPPPAADPPKEPQENHKEPPKAGGWNPSASTNGGGGGAKPRPGWGTTRSKATGEDSGGADIDRNAKRISFIGKRERQVGEV